jgi:hypothetical protein
MQGAFKPGSSVQSPQDDIFSHPSSRVPKRRADRRNHSAAGRSAGAAETTKNIALFFIPQKPQQNRMSSPKTS